MVEELLKSGQLPCLVATSSLELGIDMGAVDLVIQVESPKSVTRGLQRIGRAGHTLDEVSVGRIFPKFRADLLECAVVARRMREGEIEETVIPRNPLDVLAQHLVSMCADDEWHGGRGRAPGHRRRALLRALARAARERPRHARRALPVRPLRGAAARGWSGTAPPGSFAAVPGARQLAVTNAGTIPDRGLYGVHLPDGRRVGELDEEMVYEARPGQTFLLGATTWRIEEITRDRVVVTPAPGVPGAVPFWKGDGVGRPAELGKAIGAFAREAVSADPKDLAAEYDLDRRAAENLVAYLREQQAATRVVPSDETVVVERFRDEIGDWRLCVLSPWGGRVHAAWGLALSARIRDEHELEADAIWSDDGIVVHLPDADEVPPADLVLLEADEVEDLVVRELASSALFGARFRENAARALLIPRAYPGKRTPLWQQRLKAQSLLEVAKDFPRFPIVLETYRECLRDVLDLPSLESLLRDLSTRRISLVEVETPTASPFASSLLFDYVATYMYEGDTPNAERRAAALSLDRELLRELLGQEELRELIDPEALAEVEDSLQHRAELARAKDRDALQQILRRLGDLTAGRVPAASGGGLLGRLDAGEARARAPRRARSRGRRGALDRLRGRGAVPRRARACRRRPGSRRRSWPSCRTRWWPWSAAMRAPTGRSPPGSSRVATAPIPRPRCASWSGPASWSAGSCSPAAASASGAIPEVLRRLRRASLAHLRARGRGRRPARAGALSAELAERRRPPSRRAPAPTGCARAWCRSRASR